jgi:hypothetical protein
MRKITQLQKNGKNIYIYLLICREHGNKLTQGRLDYSILIFNFGSISKCNGGAEVE